MLTIHRQAVEGFIFPEENKAKPDPITNLTRLAAEICERIEEMEEERNMSGGAFIAKLTSARMISPKAFRMAVQLLHGNTERMDSYATQACKRGISRQTVFLEFKNELARIEHIFPELVATLREAHENALRHEDPVSTAEALRDTGALT